MTFFVIPAVALKVDSVEVRIQKAEEYIQEIDRRMEKIEERWTYIERAADKPEAWLRWIVGILIGLASVSVIGSIFYGIISTRRVERDLREFKLRAEEYVSEFKEMGKEIETFLEEVRSISRRTDYMGTGYHYLSQKKTAQALGAFEKALEEDPENAGAWFNKGYCLAEMHLYAKAAEAYKEATRLNPDDGHAHHNLARALAILREHEEALKHLEMWKKLADSPPIISPWKNIGFVELQKAPFRKRFIEIVGPPPKGKKGKRLTSKVKKSQKTEKAKTKPRKN